MANRYDFTPELKKKILAKIEAMGDRACPECRTVGWEMPDGIATIPLLKNVWTNERTSGLPCAAMVCTTCGYTRLFNLVALGFALDIGPDMDEMRKRWDLKA